MKHYFFCGIGGIGMSSLALALKYKGNAVSGSDRSFDRGLFREKFSVLERQGIALFPQDGSAVTKGIDCLVVSSAVEDSIPDVKKAKELDISIKKRAEILADFLHLHNSVAIAGTSGKTTTTGMTGHILKSAGLDPSIINGGRMMNYYDSLGMGNVVAGDGSFCVIEADESDGSLPLYRPEVAVVTNISLDHKPLDELRPLFAGFVLKASVGAVLNADCPETAALRNRNQNVITFSLQGAHADLRATDLTPTPKGIAFALDGDIVRLLVPGRHNAANALAAIGAADMIGIPRGESIKALESFSGIHRRLELIGTSQKGVAVIDDFAHNPDKIAASIDALKEREGRLIIIYQPHGFGPTKLMKDGLIEAFGKGMDKNDTLIMQEIYYAGGSAEKDISSNDLVKEIEKKGRRVHFIPDRAKIIALVKSLAKTGDRVVIMGARDDSLNDFAVSVFEALSE